MPIGKSMWRSCNTSPSPAGPARRPRAILLARSLGRTAAAAALAALLALAACQVPPGSGDPYEGSGSPSGGARNYGGF